MISGIDLSKVGTWAKGDCLNIPYLFYWSYFNWSQYVIVSPIMLNTLLYPIKVNSKTIELPCILLVIASRLTLCYFFKYKLYIDIWQQCTQKGTGLKSLLVVDILVTELPKYLTLVHLSSAQLRTKRKGPIK